MRHVKTPYYLSFFAVLVLGLGLWVLEAEPILPSVNEKLKGVCWVGSRQPLQGGELGVLKKIGANAISQTPFGWQADKNKPEIRWSLDAERQWWGESARGIRATADSSINLGISNMLKPHLWARGSWPGEIEMNSEQDWVLWFENYKNFIVDYAKLAAELDFPILCIGTELEKTVHRRTEWLEIISSIREVYEGKLIYAANFTEFEQVTFWDELDYIGIQAYFPISEGQEPDLNQLKKGWKKPLTSIEKLVRNYQLPVIFTEIGYCNTADAAAEPWVWPNERKESPLSEEVQARCYQAFFETAWKKPWLAGVYFWKWYPEGKRRDPDFSPQGLKAQEILEVNFLSVD